MDFKTTKRLYHTPNEEFKFFANMYKRIEGEPVYNEELALKQDITFFGNKPAQGAELGYDQFFSFTKVFPLYDARKERENRGFIPDTWRNIHQQEKPPKKVPATTSQWYGRLPTCDWSHDRNTFGRKNKTASFYSTRGALDTAGEVKYTEEITDIRI